MSKFFTKARIALQAMTAPRIADDIEAMNLRQWADLPPYHPVVDRAARSMPR